MVANVGLWREGDARALDVRVRESGYSSLNHSDDGTPTCPHDVTPPIRVGYTCVPYTSPVVIWTRPHRQCSGLMWTYTSVDPSP